MKDGRRILKIGKVVAIPHKGIASAKPGALDGQECSRNRRNPHKQRLQDREKP